MTTREAFVAVTRFGLGPKPGELARAASDPRGWLTDQLGNSPEVAHIPGPAPARDALAEFLRARRAGDRAPMKKAGPKLHAVYAAEAAARVRVQVETDGPFRERLVAFWSNHFTVSVRMPVLLGLAGAFEREAIRPHVTGRFSDILKAAVRHPAMLLYLANWRSSGPHTRPGGGRRRHGLNESLAREILELHTLGVGGGHTRRDIRELAKILTGWSVGVAGRPGVGRFRFYPTIHEPGTKTVLGKHYPEAGESEGDAALEALARHPSTARNVAAKFARHFIADDPPAAEVRRLARVFRETEGDLGELARAAVDSPDPWASPLTKVKNANDFFVSALRATALPDNIETAMGWLRQLGQPPFAAPSPAGWPDTAVYWAGPQALIRRADWAMTLAHRASAVLPPGELVERSISPVMRPGTRSAIAVAPSAVDALALVLASPEFQRR